MTKQPLQPKNKKKGDSKKILGFSVFQRVGKRRKNAGWESTARTEQEKVKNICILQFDAEDLQRACEIVNT